MSDNISANNIINESNKTFENFEPKIITNTYYDNYANDNPNAGTSKNDYTQHFTDKLNHSANVSNSTYYTSGGQSFNPKSMQYQSHTYEMLKQLFVLLNVKGNIIRIFGLDKIMVPLLIILKKWLSHKVPFLNKYIFREKISSLKISYTHYTSTYYNQQNNSTDCLVYRAILNYVYKKKPSGCKYSTNPNGNFMFFEQFPEVKINDNIWLISDVVNTNTSSVYTLELLSYNASIEKINKFIKYCSKKFRSIHQNDGIMKSTIKYYKYVGINNSSHTPMFEEYPFIQTKTFNNIFFSGKDDLIKKINYFSKNESSYRELGIPWCLGILLSGKPGTGKTSCIKATASLTKRHIVDICLSKIKGLKELNDIFYNTKINGIDIQPHDRLYILDELDLILEKITDRKLKELNKEKNDVKNVPYQIQNTPYNNLNINYPNNANYQAHSQNPNSMPNCYDDDGVTLEHLLTIMDGCVEQNGSLFMATTNHLHLIDKALTRPGRFDICLCLDNSNAETIEQIIEHFASKHPASKEKISASASGSKKITKEIHDKIKKYSKFDGRNVWSPAKITQICLSHIDSENYYDKIVKSLELEYEEQIKLLD